MNRAPIRYGRCSRARWWVVVLFAGVVFSCIRRPDNVLGPKELEDLLVDVHLSEGLIETDPGSYNLLLTREKIMKTVLHKHGVTGVQFDSTLGWYGRHLDRYVKVYDKVIARIRKEDDALRKQIEKELLQTLTMPGDSVDIWKQSRSFMLSSGELSNLLTFDVAVDENFKQQDRFILRMRVRMLPPDLRIPPRLTLGLQQIDWEVRTVSQDILNDGWVNLELASDTSVYFRNVFGNLYLPPRQLLDNQAIYVDSIQLVRIHPTESE